MDDRVRVSVERLYEYCQRIAFTMHRFGDSFESFDSDYDYPSSVLFNLQQIGETAKVIANGWRTIPTTTGTLYADSGISSHTIMPTSRTGWFGRY